MTSVKVCRYTKFNKCEQLHLDKLIIQWYYTKNKCDVESYFLQLYMYFKPYTGEKQGISLM